MVRGKSGHGEEIFEVIEEEESKDSHWSWFCFVIMWGGWNKQPCLMIVMYIDVDACNDFRELSMVSLEQIIPSLNSLRHLEAVFRTLGWYYIGIMIVEYVKYREYIKKKRLTADTILLNYWERKTLVEWPRSRTESVGTVLKMRMMSTKVICVNQWARQQILTLKETRRIHERILQYGQSLQT